MKQSKNQVSIKFILNRLLQREPYIKQLNLGEAVELTGEFINSLGIQDLYKFYICQVSIINYKGELPGNFYDIEAIRESNSKLNLNETIGKFSIDTDKENDLINDEFDFDIKENIIHVNFKEGNLDIVFKGYKLDEEGFPTIPDDERIIKGIYWYIAHQKAYEAFMRDEISQVKYQKIEQEHLFYLGSSRYKGKMPNKMRMQSIVDQQMKVVPNMNLYRDSFLDKSNIENYKIAFTNG